MGKMEPFEMKQTNWLGLWWHPEYSGFSSGAISLADLKKFKGKVRLYVRKNKFYNGGENGRPNYHFQFKDANSDIFTAVEVEDDEPKKLFTKEELQALINRVACDVGGDGCFNEYLVSDYIDW